MAAILCVANTLNLNAISTINLLIWPKAVSLMIVVLGPWSLLRA